MKKILGFFLSLLLLVPFISICTTALSENPHSCEYHDPIECAATFEKNDESVLTNDEYGIMSSCSHSFVGRCSGFYVGLADDVACSIQTSIHKGSGCMITSRAQYKTYGYCSICYLGLGFDYVIGTHIEQCYHTGPSEWYDTCYY